MVKRTSVLTLDWDELKRLFEEARALPPEQHEAFLDDKCGHDRALRDELVLLLSSHQEADGDEFHVGYKTVRLNGITSRGKLLGSG